MNTQAVRELIQRYKTHFSELNQAEIYKWRITKHFQDNWEINAADFYPMLNAALATSTNLLASGNYFASRMLLENSVRDPEEIRNLFIQLFDEERDLLERIGAFQEGFREVNKRNFPGKLPYQDHRAVMVYLSLRYPDIFYLYKFTMFQQFVRLVDYPFRPIKGRVENVTQYLTMCSLLTEEIIADDELLEMHQTRIGDAEYADPAYHVLTQDLVYAATFHFPKFEDSARRTQPSATQRLKFVKPSLVPVIDKPTLTGAFTNYFELEREKKRIGDLGELLVLESEQERLRSLGLKRKPEQKSKSEGDGLGYDILSYDEKGKDVFIEVKTTTAGCDQPFFITRNELLRSVQDSDKFVLYRLYDFDVSKMSAEYFVWRGDLTELCINPVMYRAVIESK